MTYTLPEELTKYTILEHYAALKKYGARQKEVVEVNISEINKVDSAGLAFLLELKANEHIRLTPPSQVIKALAELYQLQI